MSDLWSVLVGLGELFNTAIVFVVGVLCIIRYRTHRRGPRFIVSFDTEFTGSNVTKHQVTQIGVCLLDTHRPIKDAVVTSFEIGYFHVEEGKEWWPSTRQWWQKTLPEEVKIIDEHKNTMSLSDGAREFKRQMDAIVATISESGGDLSDVRFLSDTVSNDSSHMNVFTTSHGLRPLTHWFSQYHADPEKRDQYADVLCLESQITACKVLGIYKLIRRLPNCPKNANAHSAKSDAEYIGRMYMFLNKFLLM